MSARYELTRGMFVSANPGRDPADSYTRILASAGLLRLCALGTRRGIAGVPEKLTRLNPKIGLAAFAAAACLSPFRAESFRFRLHPWFDRWVTSLLKPGDHVISSFGYANRAFKFAKETGGATFYSAGNSHPRTFWSLIQEEHDRWSCGYPPIAAHQQKRALKMVELAEYILSPSSFVTKSFLENGFEKDRILTAAYPVDLTCFKPSNTPRPRNRPLTVISTGQLSLRKGTPYMLEAFRIIHQRHPSARFLLTSLVLDNIRPILAGYSDLPIDWAPSLPHGALADRLRCADVFVLPSIEEGFVRTAAEALACGLPVVVTPNTGVNDLVEPGRNGEVVPIRDAKATANAILNWGDKLLAGETADIAFDRGLLSAEALEDKFLTKLISWGVVRGPS